MVKYLFVFSTAVSCQLGQYVHCLSVNKGIVYGQMPVELTGLPLVPALQIYYDLIVILSLSLQFHACLLLSVLFSPYDILTARVKSQDETTLIWISSSGERSLKLASVSKIIPGQRTVKFLYLFFILV